MSLALLQAYADSGDEDAPGWNGGVPADAHEWCSGLHNLISAIYGDAQDTGVEPYWYTQCDDEFIEDEEHRRGLPIGTLKPFLNLPYDHNVTMSEVNSGKKATAVGYLLGTGEKFDKWDAFPLYFQKPGADGQLRSLQQGQIVNVGEWPFHVEVTVARILRGTKAAGTAASGKMQNCYYALIKYGDAFEYVSLQHLWYKTPSITWLGLGPELADDWLDDMAHSGCLPVRDQLHAANAISTVAKSISTVAKTAAGFISKLSGNKRNEGKKGKQVPQKVKKAAVTSTPSGQAAASDSESDGETSEEGVGTDD